ncbi:hypothetical protein DBR06_SOUSAS9610113, partial [Sousa chinensis]
NPCDSGPGSRPPAGWPPRRGRAADPRLRPGGRAAMGRLAGSAAALLLGLLVECTEAKKHCWYFEGLYPTYYICRPYEDCCGSRCCVRALSIQRLWYFWFLLMMGVLFCCGAGFFIRRRMYPPPLIEEPAFNVSYTRQPPNPTPGQPSPLSLSLLLSWPVWPQTQDAACASPTASGLGWGPGAELPAHSGL